MKPLEDLGRQLQQSGKADRIRQIAESEDGAKLSRLLDAKAVESAAKSGDSEALRRMLAQVLSTDEGRRLAENVKRIMGE